MSDLHWSDMGISHPVCTYMGIKVELHCTRVEWGSLCQTSSGLSMSFLQSNSSLFSSFFYHQSMKHSARQDHNLILLGGRVWRYRHHLKLVFSQDWCSRNNTTPTALNLHDLQRYLQYNTTAATCACYLKGGVLWWQPWELIHALCTHHHGNRTLPES